MASISLWDIDNPKRHNQESCSRDNWTFGVVAWRSGSVVGQRSLSAFEAHCVKMRYTNRSILYFTYTLLNFVPLILTLEWMKLHTSNLLYGLMMQLLSRAWQYINEMARSGSWHYMTLLLLHMRISFAGYRYKSHID